jgi:predicted nucleic acid-binding protein
MVLIDTSVWISLYRKEKSEIGQKLWALVAENRAALCGQVWVEYLGGFRRKEERSKHSKALHAFPFLETSRKAFERAAELLADFPRLGSGDAIIAATAMVTQSALFTLDKDFSVIVHEGLELFK